MLGVQAKQKKRKQQSQAAKISLPKVSNKSMYTHKKKLNAYLHQLLAKNLMQKSFILAMSLPVIIAKCGYPVVQ